MKIVRIFALIFTICLLLTGCSTRQSLSDLTIIEAVGIDYKSNKSSLTMQYLNLAKNGGTTEGIDANITSILTGEADSISNAISNASSAISQDIFFGQNKIIIFGREYVENGIDKGLDYLLRSVDSRPDVLVAMSENDASEVIKSSQRGARIPAESLYNLLETGEKNGFGAIVSVNDLLNMYSDPTSDIYLPVISAGGDSAKVSGIAIFSKEKYKTTLNKNQSLGFLILQNKIDNAFVSVSDNKLGNIGIEITNSKAKIKLRKNKDSYSLLVNVKLKLTLDEVENGITVAINQNKINDVEKLVNKRVSSLCEYAINTCVSNESDALMLGRYLAKSDSQAYNEVKDKWRESLNEIKVNVTVSSELQKVNDTALRG